MEKEFRVYLLNTVDVPKCYVLSEESFIEEAESYGTVFTLKGFQEYVNNEGIKQTEYIRIIQND